MEKIDSLIKDLCRNISDLGIEIVSSCSGHPRGTDDVYSFPHISIKVQNKGKTCDFVNLFASDGLTSEIYNDDIRYRIKTMNNLVYSPLSDSFNMAYNYYLETKSAESYGDRYIASIMLMMFFRWSLRNKVNLMDRSLRVEINSPDLDEIIDYLKRSPAIGNKYDWSKIDFQVSDSVIILKNISDLLKSPRKPVIVLRNKINLIDKKLSIGETMLSGELIYDENIDGIVFTSDDDLNDEIIKMIISLHYFFKENIMEDPCTKK